MINLLIILASKAIKLSCFIIKCPSILTHSLSLANVCFHINMNHTKQQSLNISTETIKIISDSSTSSFDYAYDIFSTHAYQGRMTNSIGKLQAYSINYWVSVNRLVYDKSLR